MQYVPERGGRVPGAVALCLLICLGELIVQEPEHPHAVLKLEIAVIPLCFRDFLPRRLSFLQGNYVTLTNMSDRDIDRIIRYHLEPINISFHTMNPRLRCEMLHNRFPASIYHSSPPWIKWIPCCSYSRSCQA